MKPVELFSTMQVLLSFSQQDAARLVEIGPLLLPHGESLAEFFYAALDSLPESKALLDGEPGRRMRLHTTLKEWYTEIFSGQYDEGYAQRRWIIGLVHVMVGIPPKFVVASMENVYRFSTHTIIEAQSQLSGPVEPYIESLSKMLSIDLAFIEQSYSESTSRAMALEIGADHKLFQRFAARGAAELLQEIRSG